MSSTNRILPAPSLGNHWKDARNLASLLNNIESGFDTYIHVFEALEAKHGRKFRTEYYKEVRRNG